MFDRKLIEYLPYVLRDVLEYKSILDVAEQPEAVQLFDSTNNLMDDGFISTATVQGLKRWENMLGIPSDESEPIDSRRSRVLARWNEQLPYTIRSFMQKLITLQGNDNITIDFDKDTYTLTVVTHLENKGQQESLAYLFEQFIPCNLVVVSYNYLDVNLEAFAGLGMGITNSAIEFVTTDLLATVNKGLNSVFGNGITSTEVISIKSN